MTRGLEQLVLIHLKYFESYPTKISRTIVLADGVEPVGDGQHSAIGKFFPDGGLNK